ncbi:squalene/phytoene synthase family protein [Terasakiella sp. A23]|uniref:squalene/phytoene synthase family protein n=1 Tax=Terasakiella sp. FCG-A23 TaxID=3080561 RepID=UPI002952DA04|nr:squalene/phytoene synthase family protein [Terasakiella sp. A23]MDV7338783.1 squalene/phytoene synthase family protein [Terasakiella sp. A23]
MTKTHKSENFPVASLLLAKEVRTQVLDFYQFARCADDIADSPDLAPEEKLKQLDMETDNPFLADLLIAFRQDATQNRYETWDDLLSYCRYSANPVGRFLLDVHGEKIDPTASDVLCTALQILNHLQDCQKDFQAIDRIYLPTEFLEADEGYETLLSEKSCSDRLRKILNICLERTDKLIKTALPLAQQVKNRRLRYQVKVTILCALALAGKLKKQDPLATRVELTKMDKLLIAYRGFYPL